MPLGTELALQLHPGNQCPSPEPPRWVQADPEWASHPTVLLALATGSAGDQGTPTGESLGAGTGFIPAGAERSGSYTLGTPRFSFSYAEAHPWGVAGDRGEEGAG